MKILPQLQTKNGQIFPSPRPHEIMQETPPTFSWLEEADTSSYCVRIRKAGKTELFWSGETEKTFITPAILLTAGDYEWNLSAGDANRGWYPFSISPDAVEFLRPTGREIFDSVPDVRPRHLFFSEDIPSIISSRPLAIETLRRNIALALADGLPTPPAFHRDENALPYREYFGRHRDFCDRNLVACALGHALLQDEQAGAHAKNLLLTLCDWNSEGPCSLESIWGDEIGLSHARCLPAAFDLCYDLLTEKQRIFVARTIAHYAEQCLRLLRRINFCQNPGNSHAGRLPAYLGEAAMVLKGTGVRPDAELISWLDFAVEIYGGIFPYFGGPDGGWAEGPFYASSYTKWFLPFFLAVERYSGVSFLCRPFYRHLIRFFQHFCPPGWEIHPFGDGYWSLPDDAEWPGFMAQNPYHIYAERFGDELMKKWSREAQQQEIFKLHLLDVFLPERGAQLSLPPESVTRAQIFPDAGLISLHTDPANPGSEIALLARCSRYASISHSHADQGNFALLCGGVAMIAPSGYFGRRYGTRHHFEWTNQTKAHNTILIDGMGQKPFSFESSGRVLSAQDHGDHLTAEIDPANAYPQIDCWKRHFSLTESELIVTDHIQLKNPGKISWLLHTLSCPEEKGEEIIVSRKGIRLSIQAAEGLLPTPQIRDQYDVPLNEGEPEAYHVSMPSQFHLVWETESRREHRIQVRFCIQKEGE